MRLASLTGKSEYEVEALRRNLGVRPVYKRIDTCAAEFASPTAYMYSAYETPFAGVPACEARPTSRDKIVILGGGPNRIGQGIEFDYCCCHACFALSEAGYETIMINCNPETVSTDYDTSDRLYFEPLTREDVLEILAKEQEAGTLKGVIVQFGGQTPLKLAKALQQAGIPILGTSVDSIDLAEDRDQFKRLLDKLGLKQPKNGIAYSVEQARIVAQRTRPAAGRAPVLCARRPRHGDHPRPERARRLSARHAAEPGALRRQGALSQRQDRPDQHGARQESAAVRPLSVDAIEVDVDCLCDGEGVFVAGIMEHIEEAGIHSGDSACSLPPRSLSPDMIARLEEQTRKMALALNVGGLMNVQYALKDGEIYVLEVNPRASRTVPFVAKVIGAPIAKIASRIMAGETLASFGLKPWKARPCRR